MAHRSRRPTDSDSGYDSAGSSPLHHHHHRPKTSPADSVASEAPQNAPLLALASRRDLSASIGTQLSGVQLSSVDERQLDELAALVVERGVVVFSGQDDVGEERMLDILEGLGRQKSKSAITGPRKSRVDVEIEDSGAQDGTGGGEWMAEESWHVAPSSYSIFRADEDGGETAWVSQYGLYDMLSAPMKRFVDSLQAAHTSNLTPTFPVPATCTVHPAVLTHPATRLKALNVTPGAVSGFVDMSKRESDNLLQLLEHNMHSAAQHTARVRWSKGRVAIWDNRCTALKHIVRPAGRLVSCVGEKPHFDARSESRAENAARMKKEDDAEKARLEEVKRRFNDTPLRRILRRQGANPASAGGERSKGRRALRAAEDERERKRRFNETPLRRILSRQSRQTTTTKTTLAGPSTEPEAPRFTLRSNSQVRAQEQIIWRLTSTAPTDRKPLVRLRSESEVRAYEQTVWALGAARTPLVQMRSESEVRGYEEGIWGKAAVQKKGEGGHANSPLRRIIQRQGAGTKRWRGRGK